MADFDGRSCRIYDGDRGSKIPRDTFTVLHHGLKHEERKIRQVVYGEERVFPRTSAGEQPCLKPVSIISSIDEMECWFHEYEEKEAPFLGVYRKNTESESIIVRFKRNLLAFDGTWHTEDFMSWVDDIEDFFEEVKPPGHLKCVIVLYKMGGAAYFWWKKVLNEGFSEGKTLISSWSRMKKLLISKFAPSNCSTKDSNENSIVDEKSKERVVCNESVNMPTSEVVISEEPYSGINTKLEKVVKVIEHLQVVDRSTASTCLKKVPFEPYSDKYARKEGYSSGFEHISTRHEDVDAYYLWSNTADACKNPEYEDANTIKALITSSRMVPINPSILELLNPNSLVTSLINKDSLGCGTEFNNANEEQPLGRIYLKIHDIDFVFGKILMLNFDPGGAKTDDPSGELQQALLAKNARCVGRIYAAYSICYHAMDMKLGWFCEIELNETVEYKFMIVGENGNLTWEHINNQRLSLQNSGLFHVDGIRELETCYHSIDCCINLNLLENVCELMDFGPQAFETSQDLKEHDIRMLGEMVYMNFDPGGVWQNKRKMDDGQEQGIMRIGINLYLGDVGINKGIRYVCSLKRAFCDIILQAALLVMYVTCKYLKYSIEVFSIMKRNDLVTWISNEYRCLQNEFPLGVIKTGVRVCGPALNVRYRTFMSIGTSLLTLHYVFSEKRSAFVEGKFTRDQSLVYDVVLNAHNAVISTMRPRVWWVDMNIRLILEYSRKWGLVIGVVDDMHIKKFCAAALEPSALLLREQNGELRQKGGIVKLVIKFTLRYGSGCGALSLSDQFTSYKYLDARLLFQHMFGFVWVVFLILSPVGVQLPHTLVQRRKSRTTSRIVELACIVVLIVCVLLMDMKWGK